MPQVGHKRLADAAHGRIAHRRNPMRGELSKMDSCLQMQTPVAGPPPHQAKPRAGSSSSTRLLVRSWGLNRRLSGFPAAHLEPFGTVSDSTAVICLYGCPIWRFTAGLGRCRGSSPRVPPPSIAWQHLGFPQAGSAIWRSGPPAAPSCCLKLTRQ